MDHQCMFDGDESNEVRDWFVQELVHPIHWNCPHPDDLPGPEDSMQFDETIRNGLRNLGLCVCGIFSAAKTVRGILPFVIAAVGKSADFILTDQSADEADFLFHTLVVIDIHSQTNDTFCELQMIQVYLLLLIMNTKALL